MAGHSQFANIKYRKERQDAVKGKLFSKFAKQISVAAKSEPNPAQNPALADLIDRARAVNMPKENIERAIKRATGELPGQMFEEAIYEGYGPFGVAVMVRVITDNRNRTVAGVRKIFEDFGGNMGGSVAWMFERRGVITLHTNGGIDQDDLLMKAIDLGAEDLQEQDGQWVIYAPPEALSAVKKGLEALGITNEKAEVTMVPKTIVALQGKEAEKILKFMERLDENDDVQETFANFDVPAEALAQVGS
ncbi:YebC/PmpR family DNA-binding transcriptional regulator [Candidatus Acetothermia bacterium]|nr:YebC/PmpR family DNA-binding transcriptional regulator [Candidatus Acetothermia bacterium]MBI3643806.1 YebC/PmpR family DNA-binding transcriptional regulator [Candidatus Acetothermia bacterium]